jgi:hypothetical protein
MKRLLPIFVVLSICSAGCGRTRVVAGGDLPVYGTDPLVHTVYTGTDDRFHHFSLQRGKSGGNVVVRREDATIKPEPFHTNTGRRAFVKAAKPGEVELVVLRPAG